MLGDRGWVVALVVGTNPADIPKPTPKTKPPTKETDPEPEEDEDEPRSTFSKRKVASNAWRYEATETPDLPFSSSSAAHPHDPPPEPEPDYVSLTLAHESTALREPETPKLELDYAFLAALKGKEPEGEAKSKVLRVKKAEFVEVEEKIKKKNQAEAFRARFAGREKVGGRKVRVRREEEEGGGVDDVDAFLGELELGDKVKEEVKSAVVPRRTPVVAAPKLDAEDEWLDSMLGR